MIAGSTTAIGRLAEERAGAYLQAHGFKIVGRNWRNRWCELDIIASNGQGLRFVEVKYRRSSAFGRGVEYVDHHKLDRLRRASAAFCQRYGYKGDYQIDVIAVEGDLASPVIEHVENVGD